MNHNRDIKRFLILEGIIYIGFTTIDVASNNPNWIQISALLKLMSIGLCLAFLGQNTITNKANHDSRLMVLIMSLTLASDVFLLLTRQFVYGLVLFVLVQLLYSVRIQKNFNIKSALIKGFIFVLTLIFFMILLPLQFSYALMLSLGAFYALLFAWNLIRLTLVPIKHSEKSVDSNSVYDRRLFIIGLVLYALCDLNVAIYNFPSYFESNMLMTRIYEASALAMWSFYLPGQVALTLSVRRKVDGK